MSRHKDRQGDLQARQVDISTPPPGRPNDSVTTIGMLRFSSGPIPSADELSRYEAVLPGSAERLMRIHERQVDLMEAQVHHRIDMESRVVSGDSKRSWAGLIIAALIVFGAGTLAYAFGRNDQEVLAGAVFTAPLLGIVGAFIYGTKSRRQERSERSRELLRTLGTQDEHPGAPSSN